MKVTNPPPPPPLQVQLTVDSAGSRSGSAAVVHGTVTCNQNVVAPVQVSVSQAGRRSAVSGTTTVSVNCSTSSSLWSATVSPASGSFGKGTVTVSAQTSVVDSFYSNYTDKHPVVTAAASEMTAVRLK